MLAIEINQEKCIQCGRCVKICPSMVFAQEKETRKAKVLQPENCIVCGHCVAVCPTDAVEHSDFPPDKLHTFDYKHYPTPEQMMLLCRARRSNRAFSGKPVPQEFLQQIVEAAHRAPTASNAQQVAFTVVTDPVNLRMITDFTLEVYGKAMRKMKNPFLKSVIKFIAPDILRYLPVFERLVQENQAGKDLILRKAKAVIFIHAPEKNRFACQDANLAYQNGSLMAECLGVSQFYTGFVCSAIQQAENGKLERMLGIEGRIQAGMALGMPAFRYEKYVDRQDIQVKYI